MNWEQLGYPEPSIRLEQQTNTQRAALERWPVPETSGATATASAIQRNGAKAKAHARRANTEECQSRQDRIAPDPCPDFIGVAILIVAHENQKILKTDAAGPSSVCCLAVYLI